MKKYIIGLVLILAPLTVYAACTYHTYTINGKITNCTTCCYNGICNTSCN